MATLTDIAAEYLDLVEAMADAEGCDEGYLASVAQMLDDAGDRLADKAEGYASVIRELELRSAAISEEADRLAARAKTIDANVAWMKQTLLRAMEQTGQDRIVGDRFTVRRARNGTRPLRLLCDVELLPDEYVRVRRDPDKRAISDALKSGTELPFAVLDEAGHHLRIS